MIVLSAANMAVAQAAPLPYEEAFTGPAARPGASPGEPPTPGVPVEPPPGWSPALVTDKIRPQPDNKPVDPAQLLAGQEVTAPPDPMDERNRTLDVRQKLFYSMNNDVGLRINYVTLAGTPISRRILPDYVYYGSTRRHVVVAWDSEQNDWRAFVVDRITNADLAA